MYSTKMPACTIEKSREDEERCSLKACLYSCRRLYYALGESLPRRLKESRGKFLLGVRVIFSYAFSMPMIAHFNTKLKSEWPLYKERARSARTRYVTSQN